MTRFRTLDHPMMEVIAWDPARPAERINDHLLMVRATSNAYLITGDEGDVVINTGTAIQGKRVREKFEEALGRPLKVARIIYTQSHPDHIGGWEFFADAGVETIVQREFGRICAERKLLGPFFGPRNARVLAALITKEDKGSNWFNARDPEPLTCFADGHAFEFSGRRYELISISSGETLDSLAVWMPDEKTLFIGNWAGAIYGALPNFYTARGDRDRSVAGWLNEMETLLALDAEMLVTGHGEPIRGAGRIKADLTKLRDAVRYIHDQTVEGMNAQKDLPKLMAEIRLPAHLQMAAGRGVVSWYVRAVWEEYAGWFRHQSTTELYPTPPSSVWPELAELAGGADVLAKRAQAHVQAGRSVEALHLLEVALVAEPRNRAALEAELAAYEQLADATEGKVFDELGWLEGRIIKTKEALAAIAG
jgi:alkyl sulfatase BDS1-like metallo-beta-lactamase superfamily hydrolase